MKVIEDNPLWKFILTNQFDWWCSGTTERKLNRKETYHRIPVKTILATVEFLKFHSPYCFASSGESSFRQWQRDIAAFYGSKVVFFTFTDEGMWGGIDRISLSILTCINIVHQCIFWSRYGLVTVSDFTTKRIDIDSSLYRTLSHYT